MNVGLFAELNRRNVVRVAVMYVVASWLILQVADVLMGVLEIPPWTGKLVFALLAIGFPLAIIFSWVYEITPEGVKKEHEVERSQSITALTARRLDLAIGALAVLAILAVVADRLIPESTMPAADPATQATSAAPRMDTGAAAVLPSIAVLPFVDMSQAKDQEYFADGLSEELLNLLAKIDGLRVIARTSSFQFKGRNEDLRKIGEMLGVAHILEGSVRKSAEQLRITAQLIRTDDGSHVWSETYDRKLADVFAMQDDIAQAVVGVLKLKLIDGGARRGATTRAGVDAHDHVLQGRHQNGLLTPESLNSALEHFQAAIELEPDNGEAWTGMATVYLNQTHWAGELPVAMGNRLARQAAERAIALSPDMAGPHQILAFLGMTEWNWPAAERHIEQALALAGTDPDVLKTAAQFDRAAGNYGRAIERLRLAIDRDPLNPAWHESLSANLIAAGLPGEAEAAARRANELSQEPNAYDLLATALLMQGRFDEADRASARVPSEWRRLQGIALTRFALGKHAEADAALETLVEQHGSFAGFQIAEVYAYRGETDRAFEWLEKAVAQHDSGLLAIRYSPLLKSLRQDPRYQALLDKLNLPGPA